MNDPRVSALICGAAAAWLGYTIVSGTGDKGTLLSLIQWPFFMVAVAGLAVALARIVRGWR